MKRAGRMVFVADYGVHGAKVHVRRERGTDKVTVRCRAKGIARSFRGPEAEDMARGFAQQLARNEVPGLAPAKPTLAELWQAYCASSDFRNLRPRSQQLYTDAWMMFVRIAGHGELADDLTVAKLELVRKALEESVRERTGRPYAVNTVRKGLSIVKGVFAWGERTEFLPRNRLHAFRFKVAKEAQPVAPDEYTTDEFQRLLAALSFDKITQRTPYVLLCLCGYQGPRINAALHLRWEDVDWDADQLVWRARWDKNGREWTQPLRAPMRAVLARLWAAVDHPTEGYVFPSRRSGGANEVYTVQSFWWALQEAERRAGVTHRARRAAHGFRRMVAGDLAAVATSDGEAMRAIGDHDPRMAQRYIKRRDPRLAETMRRLDENVQVQNSEVA